MNRQTFRQLQILRKGLHAKVVLRLRPGWHNTSILKQMKRNPDMSQQQDCGLNYIACYPWSLITAQCTTQL